jgi:hypothetical protein
MRKQAAALKSKMLDNQFQRQTTADPELQAYLDDERMAIMVQNREFMKELKKDKDFIACLQRGECEEFE